MILSALINQRLFIKTIVTPYWLSFYTEAVAWRRFVKMIFLRILQYSHENPCIRVSFWKSSRLESCDFFKKKQVFSCEFCEVFNKSYFVEHLQSTASGYITVHCVKPFGKIWQCITSSANMLKFLKSRSRKFSKSPNKKRKKRLKPKKGYFKVPAIPVKLTSMSKTR